MYIQITERCNMKCRHCCMSATAKGRDMSREVFLLSVKLAGERGDYITLGGGEPTLHPLFFDFVGLALAHGNGEEAGLHVITNGKITETALALSGMARNGILGAELSRDPYHEEIDPRVVSSFDNKRKHSYGEPSRDLRGIRSVGRILSQGRAKSWGEEGCACPDLFISPDGSMYGCGCKSVSFGTVFNPDIPEDYDGECYGVERKRK